MNPERLELLQQSGRNKAESPSKHHMIFWYLQGICFLCPCSTFVWSGEDPGWLVILLWPGTFEGKPFGLSACSQKKSFSEKTLLWALKSELQPIPAEGCDDCLLLWSCHLNNDTVVWFEKTRSNEKDKCVSYVGLGRYQIESSPGPHRFLTWSASKSTFRAVSRGHVHPKFSTRGEFVFLQAVFR